MEGIAGGGAEFVQIKKAQKAVEKLTSKLGKNVDSSFIKALVSLSNSEFANVSAVNNVMNLMREMKDNLIAGIVKDD